MDAPAPMTTRLRETADGAWQLYERGPHHLLAPYVSVYEDYRHKGGPDGAAVRHDRHLPFGGVPLIWTFEGRLDQVDRATEALTPCNDFIAGMHDVPAETASTARTSGVQVNLTPIGARMLLGMSMHELTNSLIPLGASPGIDWLALGDRLRQAGTPEARFDLLDRVFIDRFARAAAVPEGVAWAWRQIDASHGAVSISRLTDALGVTRKRIVSDFREYVGLPPKTLARVARFSRAVRLLERPQPLPQWTRIAAECGYYDQAHFIREVRALSGDTPTQLLRRLLHHRPPIPAEQHREGR